VKLAEISPQKILNFENFEVITIFACQVFLLEVVSKNRHQDFKDIDRKSQDYCILLRKKSRF